MAEEKHNTLDDKLPEFDPDFSPNHPTNRKAAEAHGLRYDSSKRAYVDCSGCLERDRYGQ